MGDEYVVEGAAAHERERVGTSRRCDAPKLGIEVACGGATELMRRILSRCEKLALVAESKQVEAT